MLALLDRAADVFIFRWLARLTYHLQHEGQSVASKIFRPYDYRTTVLSLTYKTPRLLRARLKSPKLSAVQDYHRQMILAPTSAAHQQRQSQLLVLVLYMLRTLFAHEKWFCGCWTISSPLFIP